MGIAEARMQGVMLQVPTVRRTRKFLRWESLRFSHPTILLNLAVRQCLTYGAHLPTPPSVGRALPSERAIGPCGAILTVCEDVKIV